MPAPVRLCVSLPHHLLDHWLADPDLAAIVASRRRLVELRCDRMQAWPANGLTRVLERVGARSLLVTCRTQGVDSPMPAQAAWRVWRQAAAAQVAFVDVPLSAALADRPAWAALVAQARRPTRLILSVHAVRVPAAAILVRLWQAAGELGADLLKVAAPVAHAAEALPLVALGQHVAGQRRGPRVIPVATGAAGQFTRVLVGRFAPGAALAYCAADDAPLPPTGPGQLPWPAMERLWRVPAIDAKTPTWAVLGDDVEGSWSPRVHNTLLAAAGRPGAYVALNGGSRPAELLRALVGPLGLRGLSITTPYKRVLAAACHRLSAEAQLAGAVNTVVVDGEGRLCGHNTDGQAVCDSVARGVGSLAGRRVAVLGTGGLARAAVASLAAAGARVVVVSRDRRRGAALAKVVGGDAADAGALAALAPDLAAIVNATPVGMEGGPPGSPLAGVALPTGILVQECIYRPRQTALMAQAAAAGCATGSGVEVFARQAALQARLFFDLSPSPEQLSQRLAAPWLGEAPPRVASAGAEDCRQPGPPVPA